MKLSGLLLITLLLVCNLEASSQATNKLQIPTELNEFYNKNMEHSADIFSGPQYIPQNYLKKGSPFFLSDSLTKGWIFYDKILYRDVQLQWDILQNYVITGALGGYSKIILRNELIDSFQFAGHLVRYMPQDKTHNLLNDGFYDILYDGNTQVIVKRLRQTHSNLDELKVRFDFLDRDRVYVKKNDLYYLVSNKSDLLKLFHANRTAIKRLVRKEDLNWRKDFERCVVIASRYYDNTRH